MLVDGPVVLGGVGVPRADVLGLQVLQLAVDVVPLPHLQAARGLLQSNALNRSTNLYFSNHRFFVVYIRDEDLTVVTEFCTNGMSLQISPNLII